LVNSKSGKFLIFVLVSKW